MDSRILSTVMEAADSYDLVDLATVKATLAIGNTDSDAELQRMISAASAFARRYCGRALVVESIKDEFLAGRGRVVLPLVRWPVVSIDTVTENGLELEDETDFRVDAASGRLYRLDAGGSCIIGWNCWPVVVEYDAGYEELPVDLVDGVISLVKARWFARERDPQLRAESAAGIYEAQYWFGGGPDAVGGLPPDIAAIFDLYRVPMIG